MELKLITPTTELNCESLITSNRNSVLLPGSKVTFQITALPGQNSENIVFNALNDFKAIVVGRNLNLRTETWPCDLLMSAAGTLGKVQNILFFYSSLIYFCFILLKFGLNIYYFCCCFLCGPIKNQ